MFHVHPGRNKKAGK